MLHGFETDDEVKAKAATIIYAVYRSRDRGRGPSGLDMWGQIERYARSAAKRASGVDEFTEMFKRKMVCSTINPYWLKGEAVSANALMMEDGSIMVRETDQRSFGLEVFEPSAEEGKEIVDCIYAKTQIIILLVRDRLEREKTFADMEGDHES